MHLIPSRFLLVLMTPTLVATGCAQNVLLRGEVRDISNEPLPGVVVRVAGTDYETLTNANGQFSLRCESGDLRLDLMKTGYTPAHLMVTAPSLGIITVDTVQLWPLPIGEGVYIFHGHRYHEMEHPRVNRYFIEDGGMALGTPVQPELRFPVESKRSESGPPALLIAHRLPHYDARLSRLRQVKAATAQVTGTASRTDQKRQYTEPIWIEAESIPITAIPLDEPERMLVELRPIHPLDPGCYAIHWGALTGYDGIDPRVFLFEIYQHDAPEGEDSEGETPEGENPETNETRRH